MSSLDPGVRGRPGRSWRAIGISNAIGTIARATAVVVSGQLYEAFGMTGSIAMAACARQRAPLVAISMSGRPDARVGTSLDEVG